MRSRKFTIPHNQIQRYLKDELALEDLLSIFGPKSDENFSNTKLGNESTDPELNEASISGNELLLNFLQEIKNHFSFEVLYTDTPDHLSFEKVEEGLLLIQGGNFTDPLAISWASGLVSSEDTYLRICIKLDHITEAGPVTGEQFPETVQIKSTDQILKELGLESGKREKIPDITDLTDPPYQKPQFWYKNYSQLALAASLALLITITGLLTIYLDMFSGALAYPAPEQQLPKLASSGTSFKSTDAVSLPSILAVFQNGYKSALSDYNLGNMSAAAAYTDTLEPLAKKIAESFPPDSLQPLLRDYYSLAGNSHLGAALKDNIRVDVRKMHLNSAEKLLDTAVTMGNVKRLKDVDRDIYYLAWTQFYQEKNKEAVHTLAQIDNNSAYYNDSQILAERWQRSPFWMIILVCAAVILLFVILYLLWLRMRNGDDRDIKPRSQKPKKEKPPKKKKGEGGN